MEACFCSSCLHYSTLERGSSSLHIHSLLARVTVVERNECSYGDGGLKCRSDRSNVPIKVIISLSSQVHENLDYQPGLKPLINQKWSDWNMRLSFWWDRITGPILWFVPAPKWRSPDNYTVQLSSGDLTVKNNTSETCPPKCASGMYFEALTISICLRVRKVQRLILSDYLPSRPF